MNKSYLPIYSRNLLYNQDKEEKDITDVQDHQCQTSSTKLFSNQTVQTILNNNNNKCKQMNSNSLLVRRECNKEKGCSHINSRKTSKQILYLNTCNNSLKLKCIKINNLLTLVVWEQCTVRTTAFRLTSKNNRIHFKCTMAVVSVWTRSKKYRSLSNMITGLETWIITRVIIAINIQISLEVRTQAVNKVQVTFHKPEFKILIINYQTK